MPNTPIEQREVTKPLEQRVFVDPLFGERPHYFSPPSDMEQYRITSNTLPQGNVSSKILLGEDTNNTYGHHYIPYPQEAPHTFPAIKARALFTKKPKRFLQIFVDENNSSNSSTLQTGQTIKLPPSISLKQLEERYRIVYDNAKQNAGLDITVKALPKEQLEQLKQKSPSNQLRVYDFHSTDGLTSPPLISTAPPSHKNPISFQV